MHRGTPREGWPGPTKYNTYTVDGKRRRSRTVVVVVVVLLVFLACSGPFAWSLLGAPEQTAPTGEVQTAGTVQVKATAPSPAGSGESSYKLLAAESEHLRALLQESGNGNGLQEPPALVWPIAPGYIISSAFGTRIHPVLGREIAHEGVDIAVPASTPVEAAAGGIVLYRADLEAHGKTVVVAHGNGIATVYCHLSKILAAEGAEVTRGQVIAESGNTGLTTGPHLHFEVRVDGVPADPLELLPAYSQATSSVWDGPAMTRTVLVLAA